MSKLSDLVENEVVKKTIYDKLVAKVNSIDTSGFLLKTEYDTYKTELENKILDTRDLVKKKDYNTKIAVIKNKIPDVNSLATKTALTTVENKIPNTSNLVKKQTMTRNLLKLKRKLLIMIMINILQLQNLIL